MAAITFDTHAFVKRFKSAGFTEEQAETQVQAISEAMEAKELATKRDLQEGLADIRKDMAEQELRLIKWMIGTALASVGIIVTAFFAIIRMTVSG